MSVPHTLNAGAHRQGLTLVLTGGPRTVLDTHPHYDRLRCAAAHPASTPTFLTRLAEDSQPAEAAR